MHERSGELPSHLSFHTGHFGVLANIAAYEHGGEWLDALVRHLERNRARSRELLAEHLPGVRLQAAEAGYLAWLDCRALELGDDPAEVFLERGRVALSPGRRSALRGVGLRAELRHVLGAARGSSPPDGGRGPSRP